MSIPCEGSEAVGARRNPQDKVALKTNSKEQIKLDHIDYIINDNNNNNF